MTLFARNAPVLETLETDALAAKSILCVGLGNRGSTVADLLLSRTVLTSGEGLCERRSMDVRTHLTNSAPPPPRSVLRGGFSPARAAGRAVAT